jgi:methylated-DNA-protein-cysteine methyltransferase-like protein
VGAVYDQVYAIVRLIPPGKVLTYSLISDLLGGRLSAAGVGWAMRALKSKEAPTVPWHRVINSRGQLSTDKNPDIPQGLQRALLEREGVTFDQEERMDLNAHLWKEGLSMNIGAKAR